MDEPEYMKIPVRLIPDESMKSHMTRKSLTHYSYVITSHKNKRRKEPESPWGEIGYITKERCQPKLQG